MTAFIFFDPANGPEARPAHHMEEQLLQNKVEVKLMEFDSKEAITLRELYDVMSHPAVVLARGDGSLVEKWQHQLPLVSEITYLAHS